MSRQPAIKSSTEWPSDVRPHTVTFVRHGEKNGGGFSADLTEKGRKDAEFVGSRITYPVDLFICSPSPRTVSTAEGIRKGNGSRARIINCEQLAEPGLGFCTDFRQMMKSFLTEILAIISSNKAEIVIATTHNYVVEYVAVLFGRSSSDPDFLCGITVNLETLGQICESL